MADEKTTPDEQTQAEQPEAAQSQEEQLEQEAGEEAIEIPSNKYERVMMAAAEASRLNEEMRRKGTKLEGKLTLAALERVDDRKVKAVIGGKEPAGRRRVPLPPREAPSRDTLFGSPPLVPEAGSAPSKEQKNNGDSKD